MFRSSIHICRRVHVPYVRMYTSTSKRMYTRINKRQRTLPSEAGTGDSRRSQGSLTRVIPSQTICTSDSCRHYCISRAAPNKRRGHVRTCRAERKVWREPALFSRMGSLDCEVIVPSRVSLEGLLLLRCSETRNTKAAVHARGALSRGWN